jgi:hypothetical protein
MRSLTVNLSGRQAMSVCCFCNKSEVPVEKWNMRCPECKAKQVAQDAIEKKQIEMGIGKREPAAIIEPEVDGKPTGQKVFVDKFGTEVENPGYDLENDPRGWRYSGARPKERSVHI